MPGSTASGPEVSVVIPTLGGYEVLPRVLDGYARQDAPEGSFEVLVVADSAEPRPAAIADAVGSRPYPVRRLTGARPGASANRNAGLAASRAPLVLFTDDDTIPTEGLVSAHLDWHRRHPEPEVAVLGHVRWARELRVTSFMHWLDHGLQFDFPSIEGEEAGWGRFYSANASVKRAFAERVGGFDEDRLPYLYEDLDWALRASEHGLRLLYAREAVVDHLRPVTLDTWKERVRRLAVAERTFVSLHPEIEPYFHDKFASALELPRASGRGVRLARWVPRGAPWIGPRAWISRDVYFRQALAPHFLAAWQEARAAPGPGGRSTPAPEPAPRRPGSTAGSAG
jgi:GT2 family glycosyltransferase